MIELDDCGMELHLSTYSLYSPGIDVVVEMVIKAPRGTMVLFGSRLISEDGKVEAIQSFMEEHNDTKKAS